MVGIETITYGNPTQQQIPYLKEKNYLDDVFVQISEKYSFPLNGSESTQEELNEIIDYIKAIQGNDKIISRYFEYDQGLDLVFTSIISKIEEDKQKIADTLSQVFEDVWPFILKLKYRYQRPRPHQLSEHYKLALFPYASVNSDCPSFPSGYACISYILCEIFGNHYPENYASFKKLRHDISMSRIHMGLNYKSDIDVGILCAEMVLDNPEFKKKYKL